MSDLSTLQTSTVRIGAGIKLAALVFTLGAIALAADLAWMAPGHATVWEITPASTAATDAAEYRGYPAPSTPSEATEHIQAF